jgi:glutathione synthase/RimK-type ligase-like ATP-grasp enzyme
VPLSVLIITRSDDNRSVDLVGQHLAEMNQEVIRMDTDFYPLQIRLTTNPAEPPKVKIGGGTRYLDDLESCWYRRYFAGGQLPLELNDNREVCVHESRRTLYGTIASLDCFHMDPLVQVRKTDHKELQLKRALSHGLLIPRTIFSNDPDEVKSFYENEGGQIVTKMQSSFAVYDGGEEQVVFTTKVQESQLAELDNLCYCPMIFQEFLPKKLDIRCTVVGDQMFTAAIDSQQSSLTEVDWRRDGASTLDDWFPYDLPEDTQAALLKVVSDFGLNYAAADFVLTRDDRLVFLEINAGGEWLWMTTHVGLPVDRAIAEILAGKVTRRAP